LSCRRWYYHCRHLLRGFIVFDFAAREADFLRDVGEWVRTGRVKYREDIVDGLENAPASFLGMLQGKNFGKMLVRVANWPNDARNGVAPSCKPNAARPLAWSPQCWIQPAQSHILGQDMPPLPVPSHIGASSLLLKGAAISESWRVRSVLSQEGHEGVSDERTSVSNSSPHLLQS
jgi:hypothetical protein